VRFFSCFWSSVPVYIYVWPGALSVASFVLRVFLFLILQV
jgi:hypothetical protein